MSPQMHAEVGFFGSGDLFCVFATVYPTVHDLAEEADSAASGREGRLARGIKKDRAFVRRWCRLRRCHLCPRRRCTIGNDFER